jgi:cytoskeletal protein CcmA (bactofilin family)
MEAPPVKYGENLFARRDQRVLPTAPPASFPRGSAPAPAPLPVAAEPPRETPAPAPTPTPAAEGPSSRLIVGANIKLKGVEIDDCDTLIVEGRVEATMVSRAIEIAEGGAFSGKVEVDIAEIRGTFQGEMTARKRLVIHGGGRVSGKVRYGRIVVQEGAELSGDVGGLGEGNIQVVK